MLQRARKNKAHKRQNTARNYSSLLYQKGLKISLGSVPQRPIFKAFWDFPWAKTGDLGLKMG